MNGFDIVVSVGLIVAVVTGFNTGLLRSAVTILAYLVAMPVAVLAMSYVNGRAVIAPMQSGLPFFAVFLVIGMAFGKLARMALDDAIGSEAGIGDRLAGAALGAIRVGMVATTLVLVFDQLVPADRQPALLTGSWLRPLFSAVGQHGFRALPADVTATIDRLKRQRQI
jgi:membrane protein required for colicin V production